MSRLKLSKKLKPAKKAWKSLSNKIQSKLHKLKIPKPIKTTLQRLISTFHSLSHIIIPSKKILHRSLTTPRPYATTSYCNYNVQRRNNNFAAIRIDDLFAESSYVTNKSHNTAQGETSRGNKEVHNGNYKDNLHSESSGMINTIEDAWKVVVAKSPRLQVDQKAEEFIRKFREDMRLQKERSMLEYQEMLARSA